VAFQQEANRRDGQPLVDDGDLVAPPYRLAHLDQAGGAGGDLMADFATNHLQVGPGAIVEVNAQSDGTDVEMLRLEHANGAEDFFLT